MVYALVTADGSSVSLKEAVAKLPGTVKDNRIKGLLTTLIVQVNEDTDKFRKAVEVHFDAAMDRASGWVKRHQQTVAILVAFIFVASANVDTFELANRLSTDTEFREKQVKLAEQLLAKYQSPHLASGTTAESIGAENHPSPPTAPNLPALHPLVGNANAATATEANAVRNTREKAEQKFMTALHEIDGIKKNLQSGGITLGWDTWNWTFEWKPKAFQEIAFKLAGLLITMFAVALGAPFWFDVLQRVMQVRQTGISPREKEAKEGPV